MTVISTECLGCCVRASVYSLLHSYQQEHLFVHKIFILSMCFLWIDHMTVPLFWLTEHQLGKWWPGMSIYCINRENGFWDGLIKIEFVQRIVSLHIPPLSVPFWPFLVNYSASARFKAQFLSHSHHLLSLFRGAGIRGNKGLKGRGENAGLNYSFKIPWLESSLLEIVIEMSSGRMGLKTTVSLVNLLYAVFFVWGHPVKFGFAFQRAISFIPCHIWMFSFSFQFYRQQASLFKK